MFDWALNRSLTIVTHICTYTHYKRGLPISRSRFSSKKREYLTKKFSVNVIVTAMENSMYSCGFEPATTAPPKNFKICFKKLTNTYAFRIILLRAINATRNIGLFCHFRNQTVTNVFFSCTMH